MVGVRPGLGKHPKPVRPFRGNVIVGEADLQWWNALAVATVARDHFRFR